MKKILVRVALVLAVLLIVVLAVVFFSLNSIVKKGVETVGPSLTKVDVKLGSADLSPFSGSGTLSKMFVGNPDGYKTASAIEVGSIKVAVKIGSVMSDVIEVDEINIQDPMLTLETTLGGKSNLGKILDNLKAAGGTNAAPTTTTPSKPAKKFIVKDLVVNGAKVNLAVTGLGQLPTVPLPPLHLQNIGTKDNAVTASELVDQVLTPLLASAIDAGTKAIASGGKQLENLGKGGAEQLKNAAKGVTDLFKK